jgi:hypothetical protein
MTRVMAAEITAQDSTLRLTGPLVAGDAEKLVGVVLTNSQRLLEIRSLELNSGGGSVEEAIRIAALVQQLRLYTTVQRPESVGREGKRRAVCASACFLVWLGGYWRYASGYFEPSGDNLADSAFQMAQEQAGLIGLHRPYIDLLESQASDMHASQTHQRRAMTAIRAYLMDRSVPPDMIATMMSRSSREIVWLKPDDVHVLAYSPEHEELLASNCGYRGWRLPPGSSREEVQRFLATQTEQARDDLRNCERALVKRLREREASSILVDLRAGKRPW